MSTSRTCASTTTPAAPSARSSCSVQTDAADRLVEALAAPRLVGPPLSRSTPHATPTDRPRRRPDRRGAAVPTERPDASRWWSRSTARPARASPAPPRGRRAALGLRYLDTGAMYRAVTWAMLRRGVDVDDAGRGGRGRPDSVRVSGHRPGGADDHGRRPGRVGADPWTGGDGGGQRGQCGAAGTRAAAGAAAGDDRRRRHRRRGPRHRDGRGRPTPPSRCSSPPPSDARAQRRPRRTAAPADGLELTAADLARRDRLDSGRAASPLLQAADAVVLDTTD